MPISSIQTFEAIFTKFTPNIYFSSINSTRNYFICLKINPYLANPPKISFIIFFYKKNGSNGIDKISVENRSCIPYDLLFNPSPQVCVVFFTCFYIKNTIVYTLLALSSIPLTNLSQNRTNIF